MTLSNEFLSPTCAPAHGDIATYFFFEKIFRSDGEMCVSVTPFWVLFFWLIFWGVKNDDVTETHISPSDRFFFPKKVCGDISMSRRTCWWKEFVAKCHPSELLTKKVRLLSEYWDGEVAERVVHFGNKSFPVTNFMTYFLESASLYCFLLCDFGRGDGLRFAGSSFRVRWSLGRPLLCSFRKRSFQEVSYKTSF